MKKLNKIFYDNEWRISSSNKYFKSNTFNSKKIFYYPECNKLDIQNIPIKFAKNTKTKNENNYYTYNSYSADNYNFNKEMERLDIGKKLEIFLENFYNKNGIHGTEQTDLSL